MICHTLDIHFSLVDVFPDGESGPVDAYIYNCIHHEGIHTSYV